MYIYYIYIYSLIKTTLDTPPPVPKKKKKIHLSVNKLVYKKNFSKKWYFNEAEKTTFKLLVYVCVYIFIELRP